MTKQAGNGAGVDRWPQAVSPPIGGLIVTDDPCFYNKRVEMYCVCDWIRAGGILPDVPELVAELSQTQYSYRGDKMLLEDKDQVKDRIGRSPDYSDALAMTFAQRVAKPSPYRVSKYKSDYDPFEDVFRTVTPGR